MSFPQDESLPRPEGAEMPAVPGAEPGAAIPAPGVPDSAIPAEAASLSDGEWHRLHPATPLLRGGVALVVILGILVVNLRERLLDLVIPHAQNAGENGIDPIGYAWDNGFIALGLLGLLAFILIIVVFFYISWRMATFRITDVALEMRRGILFRSHRRAALDRIQSVTIVRPLVARIFGAAKMSVATAGESGSIALEYVHGRDAEPLRRTLLTLASGARKQDAVRPVAPTHPGEPAIVGLVTERVNELLAPELDAEAMEASSVVHVPVGRLLASSVLSLGTIIVIAIPVVLLVIAIVNEAWFLLFSFIPALLGLGGYIWSRTVKRLRFSIAATPSGIRVGAGLFTVTNDTIPPGRIQAVRISQPLLWRPFGWWEVRVNRAGISSENMSDVVNSASVLPVGSLDDAAAVVGLMLNQPEYQPVRDLLGAALETPAEAGFTLSPRRVRIIDPLAWKRTGFRFSGDLILLRRGVAWRHLDIVPLARVQSIEVTQGPLERRLAVSSIAVHTIAGAITPALPHLDNPNAEFFLAESTGAVVRAMAEDTSHRWADNAPVANAPVLRLGDLAGVAEAPVAAAQPVVTEPAAPEYPAPEPTER